jgi:hypothetical protein
MIRQLSRFISVFIIGASIIALNQIGSAAAHAEATPSQAITLSPASNDVAVDAGKTATESVDVINSGDKPFNASVSTAPYYVSGENYDPHFAQLPGTIDASGWIKPSFTSTTVAGGKKISLPYTISVPANTPAGGYYAVLFVETDTDDAKTGVVSHNRVGEVLYITVNGVIKSSGKISGDSLPALSFVGNIPIGAKISNSGGTHFITQATYSVTALSGNKVFNATIERYVLPQTERDITTTWSPQTIFGIFTVHRSATIDGKVQSLPDETVVIINPWVFAVLAFIIGILIGIPVQRARRRRLSSKK